jgi:CheY-like chemotaxis protein
MTAKRVLIVDDSRSARAFLARMLERHGLEVDGVRSAEEGFAYLHRQLPDALFLDYLMPGMDGFQALAQIKKDPRTARVPVMMYTSQAGEEYAAQARKLGALGVLPKQLSAADVLAAISLLGLQPEGPASAQDTTVVGTPAAAARVAPGAAAAVPSPGVATVVLPRGTGANPAGAPWPPATQPPAPVASAALTPAALVPGMHMAEIRALLESLAAEQGRALHDQLAQQLMQQLQQQVSDQGERLFAELRLLRQELAHVSTVPRSGVPQSAAAPGPTTLPPAAATSAPTPAHASMPPPGGRAGLAAARAAAREPGPPEVLPGVLEAINEARDAQLRVDRAARRSTGPGWFWTLVMTMVVVAVVIGAGWLVRPLLGPVSPLPAAVAPLVGTAQPPTPIVPYTRQLDAPAAIAPTAAVPVPPAAAPAASPPPSQQAEEPVPQP